LKPVVFVTVEAMDVNFKRKEDPKEFDVESRMTLMLMIMSPELRFWPTEFLIRKLK